MGITVTSFEEIHAENIDYFVVTALSAYDVIKLQLMNYGISAERICPFVTSELKRYCIGSIREIDIENIKEIYFEPEYIKKIVSEYSEIYETYVSYPPYTDMSTDWYSGEECCLISHACGGVVNGNRLMYSNSKEALEYSLGHKFRLIECDVLGVDLDKPMLAHDYKNFYEAAEVGYQMMTLEDFIYIIAKHREVKVLIDVKWRDEDEYEKYVEYIDSIISSYSERKEDQAVLKNQIIMEVYNEKTIKSAYKRNFQMFFTQYRNPDNKCYMNTVNLCYK